MGSDGTSALFQGQYRNGSARCAPWDYASAGAYFVTINTNDRLPWFGAVRDGVMHLSDMGHIADACWRAIPLHHDHVSLDAHIVMPDHIHGIIILHTRLRHPGPATNRFGPLRPGSIPAVIGSFKSACTRHIRHGCKDAACRVPTTIPPPMAAPVPTTIPPPVAVPAPTTIPPPVAAPVPTTIPPPVAVPAPTTSLPSPPLASHHTFAWQPRYHDRVIRDETALRRIRAYIRNNPRLWTDRDMDRSL
ncbi:MAG: hypothetical protein AAB728_01615 [Patescibacteria group bacterium]